VNKIGFVGNGSVGSRLLNGILAAGKIGPSEIIVTGNMADRLEMAGSAGNAVTVAHEEADVVKAAKYVFLCTNPSETENVLCEIRDSITDETNIISTSFCAGINRMESLINCKITKFAPTMVMENGKCVSVICHNGKVSEIEARYIEYLLQGACNVKPRRPAKF
jgi:competence protein ComER